VREKYIGLVERKGTTEQVQQTLEGLNAWLTEHGEDANVRTVYLGLVERKGTPEQLGRAVQDVREWLWKHTSADVVWNALIALLIRLGKTEEAAEIALEAISHHPEHQNLVIQQLRLFSELEDEQVVRWLYEKLVKSAPKDVNIVTHYANWLRDHDYHDEARAKHLSLIARASGNFKAHYGYGRLLLSLSELKQSAEQFRKTIGIRIGHAMAHDGLAQALNEMGTIAQQKNQKKEANRYFTEAEREFRQAIYRAEMSNQPQAIFFTNLGWFYVDRRRYATAIEAFEAALNEGSEFFGNYWGIGRAKTEQGQFQEAVNYLRIALEKAPEDCQPPASEEIPKLLQQCEEALNSGNDPPCGTSRLDTLRRAIKRSS